MEARVGRKHPIIQLEGVMGRDRAPGIRRGPTALLAVAVLLVAALAGPAWAHEGESDQAAVLVEQAISLIANEADADRVAERIHDAVDAPDQMGVDGAKVREALDLVEQSGATAQARGLLLASLGGKLPSAPTEGPAVGTETGTGEILDEFRPERGISDGGDVVLVVLGAVAIGAGLYLARRWRPPHTLRELEHPAAGEGR